MYIRRAISGERVDRVSTNLTTAMVLHIARNVRGGQERTNFDESFSNDTHYENGAYAFSTFRRYVLEYATRRSEFRQIVQTIARYRPDR